jgi:hypothetical protein
MEIIEIDFTNPSLIERYNQLFENCPQAFIQQSAYWAEVIKDLGPDRPIFLLCHDAGEDVAGLPLYLYEHEIGNILTSVPQPGPLGGIFYKAEVSKEKQEEIYQNLLHKAIEIAEHHRCMTLTLITNPFVNDIDLYVKYLQPHFLFENFTQYIPLSSIFQGDTIILRDYNRSSMLSRNLKKSKELDCIIKFCETSPQLQSWYTIHSQRHQELGAVPLSYRLFENIYRLLTPKNKAQLVLVQHNKEIASGCVYVYHKHIMDVFMLSMNSRYADFSVNYANTDYSLTLRKGVKRVGKRVGFGNSRSEFPKQLHVTRCVR